MHLYLFGMSLMISSQQKSDCCICHPSQTAICTSSLQWNCQPSDVASAAPNIGMDCPQVSSETSLVTVVADLPSVGLQCCGAGSRHVTAFVWVADSTVMRNWKWLVMNGCECRNLNSAAVGFLTLRRLMSYIYGAPILDVSRSHTTTQHSR